MEQNIGNEDINYYKSSNLSKKIPAKGRFFSNNFYLSHPEMTKTANTQMLKESLKNVSLAGLEADFNSKLKTNITFISNELSVKSLSIKDDHKEDTCTQTSKTILELAKLENDGITPDSLNNSPSHDIKEPEVLNNVDKEPVDQSDKGDYKSSENKETTVAFVRKGYITRCTHKGEEIQEQTTETLQTNLEPVAKYSLTEQFLSRKKSITNKTTLSISEHRSQFLQQTSPLRNLITSSTTKSTNISGGVPFNNDFKSQSYIEPCGIPNYIGDETVLVKRPQASRFTIKRIRERRPSGEKPQLIKFRNSPYKSGSGNHTRSPSPRRPSNFMAPTLASTQKSQLPEIQTVTNLIPSPKRGRTLSPKRLAAEVVERIHNLPLKTVPYIDQSYGTDSSRKSTELLKVKYDRKHRNDLNRSNNEIDDESSQDTISLTNKNVDLYSITTSDHVINLTISHIRSSDWCTSLKGLAELTELCKCVDLENLYPHMPAVNQRLIELLRSPRSHVCRTACQAAGHFFEFMKDTRRPEFDDIVNILLFKTADANKFIRKDANLALDCMVTHIPTFHAIRVLSDKGPEHKNSLVRVATARLMVCAVVIAGPNAILNSVGNDCTRKRVIQCLAKFIQDKSPEVRKYGERLYKTLCKEDNFNFFLGRLVDREELKVIKPIIRHYKK